jgi:hypothetical protein
VSGTWKTIAIAAGLVVLLVIYRFWSLSDIASEATKLHLRMVGESIYEFHDKTARWPKDAGDLAQTSLPVRTPVWRDDVNGMAFAIVWPNERMKPDPKDNAERVLVYHYRGVLAMLGRKWVCWGDLRTEYVKDSELRARLKTQQ